MTSRSSRLRRGFAGGLAGLATLLCVLMYAPMPVYPLWLVRLITRELSLGAALLALAALPLLSRRLTRVLTIAVAALALLPLLLALPVYGREHVSFSLLQYLTGAPRVSVRTEHDVPLDPRRPDLLADAYHAAGPGPHPFVVAIHGGSWQHGDKGEVAQISRHLAAAGISVFDLRYRLAPAHRFPAGIADVKCALGRLREQAGRFGIDPQRAALLGRSAGGEMALVAAYSAGQAELPPSCDVQEAPLRAVLSVYAATDMVALHDDPPWPDSLDGPESIFIYTGGKPAEKAAAYKLASPQHWLTQPTPPTLLIHGSSDSLIKISHAEHLNRELLAAGRTVKLLAIPLAEHGFDFRSGGIGEQLERAVAVEFLRSHLSLSAATK